MSTKYLIAISITLQILIGPVHAAIVTSTFDSNDEGWMGIPGEGSSVFVASGGNPSGHIRVTDIGGGGTLGSGAIAPNKFLGNLLTFDGGNLSIDMATFGGSGGTFPIFGTVQISGGGDFAQFDLATNAPPFSSWTSFSAPLTAVSWGKTDLEWSTILGSVTEIAISTDAFDGADTIGIDNFAITSESMNPVPIPSTMLLFGTGLAGLIGWRKWSMRN